MVKYYLLTIFALMLFGVPAVSSRFGTQVDEISQLFSQVTDQFAAVILSHNPKSIAGIHSRYDSPIGIISPQSTEAPKVRILIVPGHEPGYGGAEYRDLKERIMTVELGQHLATFLKNDPHYQVFITRDSSDWMPEFVTYFHDHWDDIVAWERASAADMVHSISVGKTTHAISVVRHNTAPKEVAYRLYGITKWANENDIDITIHIHFNDDTEHPSGQPGTHTGFAIYIPEHQYANGTTSRAVAEAVLKRLQKYNPVSDLNGESSGIVEDPDLIAIGANNTADAASVLIEYGYIYEPQFADTQTRSVAITDLAYQTYLGLEDFFDSNNATILSRAYDTVSLPYSWIRVIAGNDTQNTDVFALQTALAVDGEYPPVNKDFNQCPRTGKFGTCTRDALKAFQMKYGIADEKNIVGEKTLHILNQNFGLRSI